MFDVSLEHLKELEITHWFFTLEKKEYLSYITSISETAWLMIFDKELPITFSKGTFNVQYKGQYHKFTVNCSVYRKENLALVYQIHFLDVLPSELVEKIRKYEIENNAKEKRKEKRFPVGLTRSNNFGLLQPKQQFYFMKKIYPCSIYDVSLHGCAILSYPLTSKRIEKLGILKLDFITPQEVLYLTGIVVRTEIKNQKIALYCLYFPDPVNLRYQKRVNLFADSLE